MANYLTVQHWRVGINGAANELAHVETIQTTESIIQAPVRTMGGFVAPEVQTVEFAHTDFVVVNYYYERKAYQVVIEHVAIGPQLRDDSENFAQIKFAEETLTLKYGEVSQSIVALPTTQTVNGFAQSEYVDAIVGGETTTYHNSQCITQGLEDIILVYKHYPVKYTIKLNLICEDVEFPKTLTYTALQKYILPTPARDHYVFQGWTIGSQKYITEINPEATKIFDTSEQFLSEMLTRQTGDVELVAEWAPVLYFVALHHNYKDDEIEEFGQLSSSSFELPLLSRPSYLVGEYTITFTASSLYKIDPITTTVRIAYQHTGYNTKADGSGMQYNVGDQIIMDDHKVLFATWTTINTGHIKVPEVEGPRIVQEVRITQHHELADQESVSLAGDSVTVLELRAWQIQNTEIYLTPGTEFLPDADLKLDSVWDYVVTNPNLVLSQLPPVQKSMTVEISFDPGEGTLESDGLTAYLQYTSTWRQSAWCSDSMHKHRKWNLGQTITPTESFAMYAVGYTVYEPEYINLPVPTHPTKRFVGWGIRPDGQAQYGPNRKFSSLEPVTLYAVYADSDCYVIEYIPAEGYEFEDFPTILIAKPGESCQITPDSMPKSLNKLLHDRTFTVRGHWYDEKNYITREMFASSKHEQRCEGMYWKAFDTGATYHYTKNTVLNSIDRDWVLSMESTIVDVRSVISPPLSDFETPSSSKLVRGPAVTLKDTDKTTLYKIVDQVIETRHVQEWMAEEYWWPEVETYPTNYRIGQLISEETDSIDLWANIIADQTYNSIMLPQPTKPGSIFLGWSSSLDSHELVPRYFMTNTDTILYAVWHQYEWSGYSPVKAFHMSVEDNSIGVGKIGEIFIGMPGQITISEINRVTVFDGNAWRDVGLLIGDRLTESTNQLDSAMLDALVLG